MCADSEAGPVERGPGDWNGLLALYQALTLMIYAFLRTAYALMPHLRERLAPRLGMDVPPGDGSALILFHASSVGEVSSIAPVVREALRQAPGAQAAVSTMTDTGRRRATSLIPEARVTLAPFDFKPAVDRFLAALGPGLVIIAETELWPNLIMETARRSASLVLVNGRISERSIGRYRLIPGPMRLMLSRFDLMAMRSRKDAERAISLGAPPDRVVIAGNTKYDALPGPAPGEIKSNLRVSMGIPPGKPVITLGSARPGETEVLLEALAHVEAAPVVVIAPRHLDQVARVERVCREWGYDLGRSKSPEAIGGAGGKAPGKRVALIVNEMGKLLEFYSISDIAVLGGSFAPFGGHNPLEPASQGVPLIVGPHHENIADDMAHLVSAGAAFIVDAGELGPRIAGWLEKPDMRASAGRKAMEVVDSNRGAAARCLEEIVKRGLLP